MILENEIKDSFEEDLKMLMMLTMEERELINMIISLKRNHASFESIVESILTLNPHYQNFSSPQARKLKFFHYYVWENFSAAKAARHAGYSIKTAKQQGYRLKKEIQRDLKSQQK